VAWRAELRKAGEAKPGTAFVSVAHDHQHSLTSVFVKDIDESKAFYIDVLASEETVTSHSQGYAGAPSSTPASPTPGPLPIRARPFSPEMTEGSRSLDTAAMNGLGMAVDDCRKTYEELTAKAWSSCRTRRATVRRRGGLPRQLRQLDGPGRAARVHRGDFNRA